MAQPDGKGYEHYYAVNFPETNGMTSAVNR